MSDIIHLLPDHIANQIAAGEVIQNAASVVKELMENAIDADAHNITVNIKEAGRTLIQIIDDGKGMSETDARMAFERHATSKITEAKDLFALHTFGFRGEALASIAAIAQVELRTRLRYSELGVKLSLSGSNLDNIEPDACPEGSIFSIKNLFYNVPARRRFLKTNETEFRNILREFERVALVNPHIAFTLRHNDSEVFNLPASGARNRIINIFGKKLNQKLLPVEVTNAIVNIEGYIGHTDTASKRNYLNFFFVNGRYMRHPYFHKAVMQAYEQLLPAGETPDYFIYMTLDPATIDVNIHPTKTEIKFENERPIWQILAAAVRETLGKANAAPSIDFDSDKIITIPVYNPDEQVRTPQIHVNHHYNPFEKPNRPTYTQQDWEQLYRGFEQDKTTEHSIENKLINETADETLFPDVAVSCFQYKNRYIITPLKSGLVLIDQHRAHVRILYEKYISNINARKSVSQKTLFPEIAELTAEEASALPEFADELQQLGFELSSLGGNCYSINGLPAGVEECNPVVLLKDIIADAIEHGDLDNGSKTDMLALALARTAAVKAGKQLTVEEMEAIVAGLFSLSSNNLTPDGKTILYILSDEELGKKFKN